MHRKDFLFALVSSAALPPKRWLSDYIPPAQHDLELYLDQLRRVRSSIASATIIRLDHGDTIIEGTEWPSLLEEPARGCNKHRLITTNREVLADLTHTILASAFYPSPHEQPNSEWGVIFKGESNKRLWAIYLAGPRWGIMPNLQSFVLGDGAIHDWLMTHFGDRLKGTCPPKP